MNFIPNKPSSWLTRAKGSRPADYIFASAVLALYFAAFFILFRRGLVFCADSVGYLNYYISQPPLYPLLIKICGLLSGQVYGTALLAAQIILGLFAITVFSVFLYKQFGISRWIILLLSFILFEPYFFGLRIGNNMATESLAYPLFLFTVKYLFEGVKEESVRKFALSFFFLSLLVLTRAQFLFLYPLVALIIIYLRIFTPMDRHRFKKLVIVFIAFIAGFFLIDKGYHYTRSGSFSRPTSGIQLATNVMYVSSLKDSTLFSDRAEKEIYVEIMTAAEKGQLTKFSSKNGSNDHYWGSYTKLMTVILDKFLERYGSGSLRDSVSLNREYNFKYLKDGGFLLTTGKMTKSISKTLLSKNWRLYFRLVVKSIFYELDYPIELLRKAIFFICIIGLFLTGIKRDALILLIIAVLAHLMNLMLIASVEHILNRYTFYTDITLFIFFVGVFLSSLQQGTGPKEKTRLAGS